MRLIAFVFLALAASAGTASAQQLRECTQPNEIGCERPLIVTGGQCQAIAGNAAASAPRREIDRFTNACFTCDDLDMDFRFGEQLGFFKCQPRITPTTGGAMQPAPDGSAPPAPRTAAPMPTGPAPEPAWQQRDCTRYGLQRENQNTLALTVQNRCEVPITVEACATWHDGRDSGRGSGKAVPGADVVLRWPVDVYTRAQVVWNFCRPGELCPAPCQ